MRVSESGLVWHVIEPVIDEENQELRFVGTEGEDFGSLSFEIIRDQGEAITYQMHRLWVPALDALRQEDGRNHAIDAVSFQSDAFKGLTHAILERILGIDPTTRRKIR